MNVLNKLRSALAYYKVPKYILEVEEVPKTATGKIRSEQLRETATNMIDEMDQER